MEQKEITDANFEAEVLGSDLPVLLDFCADRYGSCRTMAPAVEALAEEYKGRLKVVKVDPDRNEALVRRFQIKSIPALHLVRRGALAGPVAFGLRSKEELKKLLESRLANENRRES